MLVSYILMSTCVLAGNIRYARDVEKVLQWDFPEPISETKGEVYVNHTQLFTPQGDYGDYNATVLTLDQYMETSHVNSLFDQALKLGFKGDAYALLAYLTSGVRYAGDVLNNNNTGYMQNLADLLEISTLTETDKNELKQLTTVPAVPRLIEEAWDMKSTAPTSTRPKRWDGYKCHGQHRAWRDKCRVLLDRVREEETYYVCGPRNIEYRGCYISWSQHAEFHVSNLYNAAQHCWLYCAGGGDKVSCLVRGVELNGYRVTQCLSNRGSGCKD